MSELENEVKKKEKAEFTNTEMGFIYALVDEFGGDNKPKLLLEIKSLIRYDRSLMKGRILSALRNLL